MSSSFVTLWTVAGQTPLSMGSSRQEYWSGLPCTLPRDHPDPKMEPMSLMSPALAGGLFTTSTTWEVLKMCIAFRKKNAFVNIKINFCVSGFSYQLISHKVSSWDRLKNLEIEVMNIFSAMTAVFTKVIFISNFKGWHILYRYIYSLEISVRIYEIYGI